LIDVLQNRIPACRRVSFFLETPLKNMM